MRYFGLHIATNYHCDSVLPIKSVILISILRVNPTLKYFGAFSLLQSFLDVTQIDAAFFLSMSAVVRADN